jgi:hypothetical protein
MAGTFAEKFEKALSDRKEQDPRYGLRTLARQLANDDGRQAEIIRRRLHKYRPPKGGGAAIVPTAPTRWEIEDAMGLPRDALRPDEQPASSMVQELLAAVEPFRGISRIVNALENGELVAVGRR